tara:strand:+ start:221 stop:475 length:255 start_codon:yes stop_codon:yes gene_type:complete
LGEADTVFDVGTDWPHFSRVWQLTGRQIMILEADFRSGLRSGPASQAAILSFDGCSLDQKQRDEGQVLRVKYSIAGFNCDIGGS